jgi:hypothetical protein
MSRSFEPGELEELGERLKIEFGLDRQVLNPEITIRLARLEEAERRKDARTAGAGKDW